MAFSDLWPSWIGGTAGAAGGLSPALSYTDAASAMNPALAGMADIANVDPSAAGDIASSINPNWSSATSGMSGTAIAKALKDLQGGLQQQQGSNAAANQQRAQAGTAQSGTGQGSAAGINALIQMLLQRSNQYFPGQPNRQPVALARPSGGGLLGI